MTQAQSPLDQTLAAAASQAAGDSSNTAQPISQTEGQATVIEHNNSPAVANQQVAAYQPPASPLTMQSNEVQAQSSITEFFKLTDGGCSVGDVKYNPLKVLLRVEDATNGGGFRPAYMMNYEAPSGMVYTKSFDGAKTTSNNPAHSGLSWADNKRKILEIDPKAYDYLGYDIALVVAEDTKSKDEKTTLAAGTVLGFTTPYTAAKMFKKVWDNAVANNSVGKDAVLVLSGEEINNNGRQYKKLVVVEQGYAEPKTPANAG